MADHFMELLCPAGNMDKLKMAIRYGADAVYCAGKRFGLRAGNSNFSNFLKVSVSMRLSLLIWASLAWLNA